MKNATINTKVTEDLKTIKKYIIIGLFIFTVSCIAFELLYNGVSLLY